MILYPLPVTPLCLSSPFPPADRESCEFPFAEWLLVNGLLGVVLLLAPLVLMAFSPLPRELSTPPLTAAGPVVITEVRIEDER